MTRILIIDNSPDMLEVFRLLLEEQGYEVSLATKAPETMAALEQKHPDLIILDFLLEKYQEGWQFLQQVKLSRTTATIPLITCTAALQEVHLFSPEGKPGDVQAI